MALEETNILDMALQGLDGRGKGIDLLLFDHGRTTDEVKRYNLLIRKLATYGAFVTGEEFRRAHPETKPADVLIRVLCKNPPNNVMQLVEGIARQGGGNDRIAVTFESLDEFVRQAGLQTQTQVVEPPKKKWWAFRRYLGL